jgi:hypothetical protein
VPVGHIPRSMTIHLYGPLTRTISPGDVVDVSGVFLPTPYTGLRAMRAGLLQDTFLEAQFVRQMKKSYNDLEMTEKTREELERLQEDEGVYHKLAQRCVEPLDRLIDPEAISFPHLPFILQHCPGDLRPRGRQEGAPAPPRRRRHQERRRRHEDPR